MATRVFFPQAGARNEVATCYGLIFDDQGQVRQFTTDTFVAYVTANLDDYDTGAAALPASGHYALPFPATIPAGRYWVECWKRTGGAVDETTDTYVDGLFVWWDGDALVEIDGVSAAVGAITIEAAAGDAPAFTLADVLKQLLAMAAGQTSGMHAATGNVKNPSGFKTRAQATLDGNGNRTVTSWDNS